MKIKRPMRLLSQDSGASRTQKTIKNVVITMSCQVLAMLINFVARKCFILVLNDEYLGISSLFSTILTMLSLVELGLAPAMVFSMYKPLAEKDYATASALMIIYKKAYTVIGSVALILGWAITPFIHIFINEMPQNVEHIHVIYMLFVLNTGISYFFSYKRSLLTADQNQYVLEIYHYVVYFSMNVLQIGILFLTRNYFAFLALQIFATVTENVMISRRVDKTYPWLKETQALALPEETTQSVVRNVKAMVFHRIGGLIVDSTDNILISRIFGVTILAVYSNYLLITKALSNLVYNIFSAITASVGNLQVTSTKERSYEVFETTQFINFWIFCFASISLFVLLNPFIETIWLGSDYLLAMSTVFVIALNFYLNGMRRTVLTFKEAFGLPWQDRFKPLVSAAANLVLSIILAKRMGIDGIFYGTILSHLGVNLWWESGVVYRHGFNRSVWQYLRLYAIYFVVFLAIGAITWFCTTLITVTGVWRFIILLGICLVVPNILIYLTFRSTRACKETFVLVKKILKR